MHERAFAESARPRPRRVLRLPLRDYSIGHELILIQRHNPLLVEGFEKLEKQDRIAAVVDATLICSQTWEQNKKRDKWLRLWLWLIRNSDFDSAAIELLTHRAEGSSFPKLEPATKDERGRELGGPFLGRVLCYGLRTIGQSVYDMPLGHLQWCYFCQGESDGMFKIQNETESEVARIVREIFKQRGDECPVEYQ